MFGDPPNRIHVFDSATFETVKVIAEGVQTLHPEFTADGQFVYVADWQGDLIRVYDAKTFEKVTEVGGAATPTGVFNTSRRTETLGH
jgi:DNA-binding beta-propeller fold protein YncE